jgi:hypothetical protein
MSDEVRQVLLEVFEESLQAQLTAVRRLRRSGGGARPARTSAEAGERRSQVGMALDVLSAAKAPLHISELIAAVQKRFQRTLDRESLVSALTKQLSRHPGLSRPAPNTFALRAGPAPGKEK